MVLFVHMHSVTQRLLLLLLLFLDACTQPELCADVFTASVASSNPFLLFFVFSGVYILIAAGALMMVVGFLGCCGAMKESPCMLGLVSGVSVSHNPAASSSSLTPSFVPRSSSSSCSSSLRLKWLLGSGGSPTRKRYTSHAHAHTRARSYCRVSTTGNSSIILWCRWWRTLPSSTSRPTTTTKPPSRKR